MTTKPSSSSRIAAVVAAFALAVGRSHAFNLPKGARVSSSPPPVVDGGGGGTVGTVGRTELRSSIAVESPTGPAGAAAASAAAAAAAAMAATTAPGLRSTPARKICLMVEPTPFTHVSGYANRFQEMLRFLSHAGDDVNIVTVDQHTSVEDLPSNSHGFRIHHTGGFKFPLYPDVCLSLDHELVGAKILRREKPDLIHVTSPGFIVWAAIFYSRIMSIPLLMSYHTDFPKYGKHYLGFIPYIEELSWELLKLVHSFADLTLVTSPQKKAELDSYNVPRVDVWRKGIDTDRFHPRFRCKEMRERMTDGHGDDFLVAYVGRLGDEKRLRDLKPVMERLPNSRLCIVGKAPKDNELRQFFEGTKTVFTGQLTGDDLSAAFASADAFVMPSDSETLGFVVLESMASGVPVVGAAAGGVVGLIDEGETGFLVPPGDTDAFAAKLELLRSDVELREEMGRKARVETERWGWEAATSVLRNVQYEQAVTNFKARRAGL